MNERPSIVRAPGLRELPPPAVSPWVVESHLYRFYRTVLRPLWGWRVELGACVVALGAWTELVSLVGPVVTALALGAVGGLLARWTRSRQAIRAALHRSRLRRGWALAVRHAGLAVAHTDRIPRPTKLEVVPAGDLLRVRFPAGSNARLLEEQAETIAAFLRVREVRIERDREDAGRASVAIVRRDPLAGSSPVAWPSLDSPRHSLWEPIPVGVDEDGRKVAISLIERNVLLGGEPGAGKSVALSMLVASAALDPDVKLTLLDGKLVELAAWAGCARRSVGVNVSEAIEVLRELQSEMDGRYLTLLANRKRKVARDDGLPLHVVVCDELAHYLNSGDRKASAEFANLLRDLVSRGRAAGIIVLAATQKPSHDIVPTALRDLFAIRWALRCTTPQASDTILGQGWASQGHSATSIDTADRGVGFLLHEGGRPVRLKASYLSDDDLSALAERAEQLRSMKAHLTVAAEA